jgi:hypothetical protein
MRFRTAIVSLLTLLVAAVPAWAAGFTSASDPLRVSHDAFGELDYPSAEHQAEPHVAVDPTDPDHLLAVTQEGRFSDGGAAGIGVYTSLDSGRTWQGTLMPELTLATGGEWERATDPVAGFGPDGTAYVNSFAFNLERDDATAVVIHRSTDGGLTWAGPFVVDRSDTFRQSYDKNWMTIDTAATSPFLGRIYVAWTNFISGQSGSYSGSPLLISHSDDGGETWSEPIRAARTRYAQGAIPLVAPDGSVFVVYLELFKNHLRIVRSIDGGETFRKSSIVTDLTPSSIPGLRTGEDLPAAAIDPVDGTLHVVWQDGRSDLGDVLAVRSQDGRTWSTPIVVNDDPVGGVQFTPAVAALGGQVHVVWYDSRDPSEAANLYTVRYATSGNGGRTFGTNLNLTSEPFDMDLAAPTERGLFLGDYIGIAATPTHVNPLWVDTRFPSVHTSAPGQNDVVTVAIT